MMSLPIFDKRITPVEVEGQSLFVRRVSAKDFLAVKALGKEDDQLTGMHLVLRSLCDEHGNRLLSDDQLEELEAWPINVCNDLFSAAMKANKLNSDSLDEIKKK